jgi:hypothetical protein
MNNKDKAGGLELMSPAGPAERSAKVTFDRFHPEMPQIPGVPKIGERAGRRAKPERNRRIIRIVGILGSAAVIAVVIVWRVNREPRKPAPAHAPEPVASYSSTIPPLPPAVPIATGNGAVLAAKVEELSKPWAAKNFTFVEPLTDEQINAVVIRLPGGGLWAFALKEPYGNCNLEFVTDLNSIRSRYGYRASHPMVVNPCNGTVYDPLKVGPLGANTWARGEIVQGGGLRPPLSIDVHVRGRSIVADRME